MLAGIGLAVAVLQRYQHAPQALLAQLEEPPEPVPEPIPPEPVNPPIVDSAKLALLITQSCTAAGISNLIEPLISTTKLVDEATVNAALTNAKSVRDPARSWLVYPISKLGGAGEIFTEQQCRFSRAANSVR